MNLKFSMFFFNNYLQALNCIKPCIFESYLLFILMETFTQEVTHSSNTLYISVHLKFPLDNGRSMLLETL